MQIADTTIDQMLKTAQSRTDRTLIMIDDAGDVTYCHFDELYDYNVHEDVVTRLFRNSFSQLKESTTEVETSRRLPLLANIGRYKITVITSTEGGISIHDGSRDSTLSHFGIE